MWRSYVTTFAPADALTAVDRLLERLGAKPRVRDDRQVIATTSGGHAKLHGIATTPPLSMPLRFGVDVAEADGATRVRVRVDENYGFQMFVGPARKSFEDKYRLAFEQFDSEFSKALDAHVVDEPHWPPSKDAEASGGDGARSVIAFLLSTLMFGGFMTVMFGLMEGDWQAGLVIGAIAGVLFSVALFVVIRPIARRQRHMGATVDLFARHDAGRDVLLGERRTDVDEQVEADAQRIVAERQRAIRRSRIVGIVIAAPLMTAGGVVLIATETFGTMMGFAGAAWFFYRLVASRFLCRERVVLVLRRFGVYDKETRVLPGFLGDVCAGLAVPITVQDNSFAGYVPMGLQALHRILAPVVSIGSGLGAAFLVVNVSADMTVLAVLAGIGTFLGVYALITKLTHRLSVSRASEDDYAQVVSGLLSGIRDRRGFYSGTRVMVLPDERWQDAIVMSLKQADAVVIDVTDVSENVVWEIGKAFELVPAEAIIVAWTTGSTGDVDAMPSRAYAILESRVGADRLARCTHRPYPQSMARIPAFLKDVFVTDLARCFAHRQRSAPQSSESARQRIRPR
jgi:hypothetical protein